jgi:rod shape-determining protein MreC
VGFLVVLSLGLITASFRSDALDPVQGAAASALRPFEIAAERVSRPFRDAWGWGSDLVHTRSENQRLEKEIERLRSESADAQIAVQDYERLKQLLAYRDSPRFPEDFLGVATRVIAQAPSRFEQRVVIAAGTADGIREDDPVVTGAGLVGQVTKAYRHQSQVALLTDGVTAVSAVNVNDQSAIGIVRKGEGGSDVLVFDRVTKERKVDKGDVVVTAGSPGRGRLPSLYPRGIKIGVVTSVGQNDLDIFKKIQVQPFVRFNSLHSVLVLVPKSRAR